jgi:DNA polymerase-3 subunit delta
MPFYFFWGEDSFNLDLEVKSLRAKVVDPLWQDFNFVQFAGDDGQAHSMALSEVMTPPFGSGARLVWVKESTLAQQCPEPLLSELKRVLPKIPESGHLLFSSSKKPDSRLKSTKFLQSVGQFKEFSLISAWNNEEIAQHIKRLAVEKGLKLTPDAIELLAQGIGNDSRAIWHTLEKLSLYQLSYQQPLSAQEIAPLVNISTQNSLQLATAIREGKTSSALQLVEDLFNQNEPALKIVATLVGQFRTWTLIKLQLEHGEKDDNTIATFAQLNNPKRLYFLKKEIQSTSAKKLTATISLLLELEYGLKSGNDPLIIFKTKVIQLCNIFSQ